MGTPFTKVYNRFLGKITDDMYIELTPEDTIKDLQNLLIDAIPGFEFPRKNLMDYEIKTAVKREDELLPDDFVIGVVWGTIPEDDAQIPNVIIEQSSFAAELTDEEINILALLMMCAWVNRQVASIENTRMKFTSSDFKMTSQANHLSKMMNLLTEVQRQSFHMQRLYKRRKITTDGTYASNWSSLKGRSTFDD